MSCFKVVHGEETINVSVEMSGIKVEQGRYFLVKKKSLYSLEDQMEDWL